MQENRFFPEIRGGLGFGCSRLPVKDQHVDRRQYRRLTEIFLDAGFNYFDTAHDILNGDAENAFRECVAKRFPRERFVLANKLKESCFMKTPDIRPLFERQLANCGVDYFDFYLMDEQNQLNYNIFREQKAYETVRELKAEGKIRHIGIVFHDTPELLDIILTQNPEIELVQIHFNYADWAEPPIESRRIYDVCVKHQKAVIAVEPIKGGKLVALPEEAERMLQSLGRGSTASYAIRFAASYPGMALVMPGSMDPSHVEENCRTMADFHPLDDKEKLFIQDVSETLYSLTEINCIGCRICVKDIMCRNKLLIPDLFAVYNNFVLYHDRNAKYYYDNVLTGSTGHGKASDCVYCGSCEKVCPQQLNIRQLLRKVAEAFET